MGRTGSRRNRDHGGAKLPNEGSDRGLILARLSRRPAVVPTADLSFWPNPSQGFHFAVLFFLGGGASELVVVRDVWFQRERDSPSSRLHATRCYRRFGERIRRIWPPPRNPWVQPWTIRTQLPRYPYLASPPRLWSFDLVGAIQAVRRQAGNGLACLPGGCANFDPHILPQSLFSRSSLQPFSVEARLEFGVLGLGFLMWLQTTSSHGPQHRPTTILPLPNRRREGDDVAESEASINGPDRCRHQATPGFPSFPSRLCPSRCSAPRAAERTRG